MKKLFKALAAISLVALFMSCELTLLPAEDSTELRVYNNTGEEMQYLFLVPYSEFAENNTYTHYSTYYTDKIGTFSLSNGSTKYIDTTDMTDQWYYIVAFTVSDSGEVLYRYEDSIYSKDTYETISSLDYEGYSYL